MVPIRKHIVKDEAEQPVAIQISLEDWLRIEPILREKGLLAPEKKGELDLNELLSVTSGIWRQGDGLDYQRTIRDEWQDPLTTEPKRDP